MAETLIRRQKRLTEPPLEYISETELFQEVFFTKIFSRVIVPYLDICGLLNFALCFDPESRFHRWDLCTMMDKKPINCKRTSLPPDIFLLQSFFKEHWSNHDGLQLNFELWKKLLKSHNTHFFCHATVGNNNLPLANRSTIKEYMAVTTSDLEMDAQSNVSSHCTLFLRRFSKEYIPKNLVVFYMNSSFYCRACLLYFVAKYESAYVKEIKRHNTKKRKLSYYKKVKGRCYDISYTDQEVEKLKKEGSFFLKVSAKVPEEEMEDVPMPFKMRSLNYYFKKDDTKR